MPRFFVPSDRIQGSTILLTGENAHHAAYALRLAVGDHITVCDQTAVYDCVLTRFDGETVCADICSSSPADTEPPYIARLYQALPKGDKLDTVIQKAVECGATEIIPFESSRCIARCRPEAEEHKTARRRRIAEEAAKQCGRGIIPEVRPTLRCWDSVLREAASADLSLFCYEGAGTRPLGDVLNNTCPALCDRTAGRPTIAIVIGSEGGFSTQEAQMAADAGLILTGLGRRILRTETASSFVLCCLSYQYEL